MSGPYFFGCWGRPGHGWVGPRGAIVDGLTERRLMTAFEGIDSGFAPRRWKPGLAMNRKLVANPECCFTREGKTPDERYSIQHDTEEYPQGVYLLHSRLVLPGADRWTLMSWWDRSQGDTRGACNSNIVAHGVWPADELFALLCDNFPSVVRNLAAAEIVIREPSLA